jgi:hypothetical protein
VTRQVGVRHAEGREDCGGDVVRFDPAVRGPEACPAHQKLVAVRPGWKWGLAETYALAGRNDDALRLVAEMSREDYPRFSGFVVGVQTIPGNKEEALRALQATYEYRHPWVPWLLQDPTFPWRSDPRFQELLRRANFPATGKN